MQSGVSPPYDGADRSGRLRGPGGRPGVCGQDNPVDGNVYFTHSGQQRFIAEEAGPVGAEARSPTMTSSHPGGSGPQPGGPGY